MVELPRGCGWCCKSCLSRPSLYRVDARGRQFMYEGLRAKFTYGEARIPITHFPSCKKYFLAQERLMWAVVQTYIHLAEGVARKSRTPLVSDDELVHGPCVDALMRSAVNLSHTFDGERGSFESYASRAMVHECRRYVRRIAERTAYDIDEIPLPAPIERGHAWGGVLNRIRSMLNDTDWDIITRFSSGESCESIGIRYGVGRTAVHNRIAHIRARCECIRSLMESVYGD